MFSPIKNCALPFALMLLCATALYIMYKDMKKINVRLARLDAAVHVLSEKEEDEIMNAYIISSEAGDDIEDLDPVVEDIPVFPVPAVEDLADVEDNPVFPVPAVEDLADVEEVAA